MNTKKELKTFFIWLRNGTCFAVTWFIILELISKWIAGNDTLSVAGLTRTILWTVGGVLIFCVMFTRLLVRKLGFTARLSVFMGVLAIYELAYFYTSGIFTALFSYQLLLFLSIIILLLMISTFIGAAHFDNGVLSVEPNSRNLIIYADNSQSTSTISARGPYTIDSAIENESSQIRMPSDAMITLGVSINDTIVIDGEEYIINETRAGEPDVLRLPIDAKKALDVETGSVIQNSRLKEIFEGSGVIHNYYVENATVSEDYIITSRDKVSGIYEVVIDNASVVTSHGIFKDNASYEINVNGELMDTITYVNQTFDRNVSEFSYGGHDIKITFEKTNSTSIKQFLRQNQNTFMNIYLD